MSNISNLTPRRVFQHFEALSRVPRGSGDRKRIADFVEVFAVNHGLRCIHDDAHNVIIYKNGSAGRENEPPVILQGHLDMVCQKTADSTVDFTKDGVKPYVDGDELRAVGTTLGADNGIAAAMILAVLEDGTLSHPPIEAVFTADEEIGMLGAWELDMSALAGRRMINLDAEEDDTLTVSCAGGSDLVLTVNVTRETAQGVPVTVALRGLRGGHSGVEIGKCRQNADKLMGALLMRFLGDGVRLVSVDGGDKGNAIPNTCTAVLCAADPDAFATAVTAWLCARQDALAATEPQFTFDVAVGEADLLFPMTAADANRVTALLTAVPDGVVQMSAEIDGLVETSLNLGILTTDGNDVILHHTLRSNKQAGLDLLEKTVVNAATGIADGIDTFGHYPPWEFKADSPLQQTYIRCYEAQVGKPPKVEAIHAGLECAVFASRLEGLDCIAIGPSMRDVHTVDEALSIPSTARTFALLLTILETL